MKITDIVCHVMGVPGPDGVTPRRNWIFVEVQTDQGIAGIGEATTEWHELAVKAQIDSEFKPRLIGMDPTDIERIWQLGYRNFWWKRGVVQTSAMSGIDMALWDIAGKVARLPVFKLLGGRVRDRIACYARGDFARRPLEESAAAAKEEGFSGFKAGLIGQITTPFDPDRQVEIEIETCRKIRQRVGNEMSLMLDVAGMLPAQQAHRLMRSLRDLNMLFVEEPTPVDTLDSTRRLKLDFPEMRIAAGERLITRWDCRSWFEQQAIDVCQADISHTGGISELMRIAHFAEIYGITMAPHNPYGPVALAASAHAAAAMPNFLILEICRLEPWFGRIQRQAVPLVDGWINVDELGRRPGLGIELDWNQVRSTAGPQPLIRRTFPLADGAIPLT